MARRLAAAAGSTREMSGLSAILGESRTACYAWALMPNHFHLLLKTGQTQIATLIRLYREFVQKEAGRGRRRELRYRASRELGISTLEPARRLNQAQPTVSQSVDRGKRIAAERRLTLLPR
jgi:hypothetical protein